MHRVPVQFHWITGVVQLGLKLDSNCLLEAGWSPASASSCLKIPVTSQYRLPHNDSPNWWAGTVTRWWSGGLKGSRAGSWCPHGGHSPPAHCCQYSCMDASSLNLKKSKAGDKVCFLWPLNLFWTFCKTQEVIFLLSDIPYFFKSDLYFYWTQLSLGSDLWVRMSVTDWLTDWATLLRLNWCDSGWWRYQLNTNW